MGPEIRQMLEAALGHHQAGRLVEAESLYRQVLAIEPENANCLHLLGMLADQAGRSDEAIRLIGRAVAIEPRHAAAQNNLGLVLQRAGRLAEATQAYRRAVAARSDLAPLHVNLAMALRLQGDLAGARDERVAAAEDIGHIQASLDRRHLQAEQRHGKVRCHLSAVAGGADYEPCLSHHRSTTDSTWSFAAIIIESPICAEA